MTITVDREKLEEVPGRSVTARCPERNLIIDVISGVQLAEDMAGA